MVRTTAALKTAALAIVVASLADVTHAVTNGAMTPQQEALKDVDMAASGIDEHGDERMLWGFNWNALMFAAGVCHCEPGPLGICGHQCDAPLTPEHIYKKCRCAAMAVSAGCDEAGDENARAECYDEAGWVQDEDGNYVEDASQTQSSGGENRSVGGASVKSNWWIFVVGAAAVGMVAAAIIMRKRRNAAAEEALDSDASLSGAVNKRAALLAGGAAAGAGAAATMPQFLSVPSFRRNPSGLEVDAEGMVIEPPPSNYMDMDNHVDSSQLPEGVEISESGNLEPYHSGSMA